MSSTNGMKESYRVAHKVGDPRATGGAKTGEWHRVADHIARCGVKTEGPGVAWVAQVGWDHKAECGES